MKAYLDIIQKVFTKGKKKVVRNDVPTLAVSGMIFEHEMSEGFPLITTKTVPYRLVSSELEFFIQGKTDKEWLRTINNNHIWDEWCSPDVVSYGTDKKTKEKMEAEREMGPIYGFQWRHFNAPYHGWNKNYGQEGIDQLKGIIDCLKTNPENRGLLVSAWNPQQLKQMALRPCHYSFQIDVIDNKLSLMWNQRSVDVGLGLPFNIASYATLLHLLAKESGLKEGRLVGFLGDVHIYDIHKEGLTEQLTREPKPLPTIETKNFTSTLDWSYKQTEIINYKHHPKIKMEKAI